MTEKVKKQGGFMNTLSKEQIYNFKKFIEMLKETADFVNYLIADEEVTVRPPICIVNFFDFITHFEEKLQIVFNDQNYLKDLCSDELKFENNALMEEISEKELDFDFKIHFDSYLSYSPKIIRYLKKLHENFNQTKEDYKILKENPDFSKYFKKLEKENYNFQDYRNERINVRRLAKKILPEKSFFARHSIEQAITDYLDKTKLVCQELTEKDIENIKADEDIAYMFEEEENRDEDEKKRIVLKEIYILLDDSQVRKSLTLKEAEDFHKILKSHY